MQLLMRTEVRPARFGFPRGTVLGQEGEISVFWYHYCITFGSLLESAVRALNAYSRLRLRCGFEGRNGCGPPDGRDDERILVRTSCGGAVCRRSSLANRLRWGRSRGLFCAFRAWNKEGGKERDLFLKRGRGKSQQTPREGGASWIASFQYPTFAPPGRLLDRAYCRAQCRKGDGLIPQRKTRNPESW
jgi:hypothetical protein